MPQRRSISSTIRCRGWSPSFCRRRLGVAAQPPQVTVSCPLGTRRGLSDRPRYPFGSLTFELVSYPTLAGRGGSVSRRDHNQAHRRRAHVAWAHNPKGTHKPIPSRSSGGSAREELLSEKLPPSHTPRRPLLPLFVLFVFLFLLCCEIYTYNLHSGVAKRLVLSYNRGAEQARRIPWISVKP